MRPPRPLPGLDTPNARPGGAGADVAWLALLPVLFIVAAVVLRANATPYWLWFTVEPDYPYLFSALNILNGAPSGPAEHPGVPAKLLVASILWVLEPAATVERITATAVLDPERALRSVGTVLMLLNALVMALCGWSVLAATRSRVAALAFQAGPLMAVSVTAAAFRVGPDPVLLMGVQGLGLLAVLSAATGLVTRRPMTAALVFGVVCGLLAALRIEAAALAVLPLLLLRPWRALLVWAGWSLAVFVLMLVPVAQSVDMLAFWPPEMSGETRRVMRTLGGEGVALSVFALSLWLVWRIRAAPSRSMPPVRRALGAVVAAQGMQVLLALALGDATLLLPALALCGAGAALAFQASASDREGIGRRRTTRLGAFALLVAALVQVQAVRGEARDLARLQWAALSVDNERFGQCARVHFAFASAPAFAYHWGSATTGHMLAGLVEPRVAAGDVFHDPDTGLLGRWGRTLSLDQAVLGFPCAVFRGSRAGEIQRFVREHAPGLRYDSRCSTANEAVFAVGVSCAGRLLGEEGAMLTPEDLGRRSQTREGP